MTTNKDIEALEEKVTSAIKYNDHDLSFNGDEILTIRQLIKERGEMIEAIQHIYFKSEDQIELNTSNYDHDDVVRLNNEAISIYQELFNLNEKLKGAGDVKK